MFHPDILLNIFKHMKVKDKQMMSLVSRQYNSIYEINLLWSYYLSEYDELIVRTLYTLTDEKTVMLIHSLKNLNKLIKSNNIVELYDMIYLNLSNNNLQQIPSEIGNLTNLQKLYLHNNKLQQIPSEIGNLTNLQYLYLNRNVKLPKNLNIDRIKLKINE